MGDCRRIKLEVINNYKNSKEGKAIHIAIAGLISTLNEIIETGEKKIETPFDVYEWTVAAICRIRSGKQNEGPYTEIFDKF